MQPATGNPGIELLWFVRVSHDSMDLGLGQAATGGLPGLAEIVTVEQTQARSSSEDLCVLLRMYGQAQKVTPPRVALGRDAFPRRTSITTAENP